LPNGIEIRNKADVCILQFIAYKGRLNLPIVPHLASIGSESGVSVQYRFMQIAGLRCELN